MAVIKANIGNKQLLADFQRFQCFSMSIILKVVDRKSLFVIMGPLFAKSALSFSSALDLLKINISGFR